MLPYVGVGSGQRAGWVVEQTLMDCLAQFPSLNIGNTQQLNLKHKVFVDAQKFSVVKFDSSCSGHVSSLSHICTPSQTRLLL